MQDSTRLKLFKAAVLAHLNAAHNLARWLTRDSFGAEEAVQTACLRAYQAFDALNGPNPKAWFMAIVRNASIDWLRENKLRAAEDVYDDEMHGSHTPSPEQAAAAASDARRIHTLIAALPREYREVLVLRELEDLSYKEISAIVEVPIGTVMSRLARGRDMLQQRLGESRARNAS